MKVYFLIIYFACLIGRFDAADTNLQLVHVFFRHGSRTPELKHTYPTDPYSTDTFTPPGWGQLTNTGKQTSFKLGQLLRERYGSFLGNIYTAGTVQAFSTDFDRTKMTALLVLAGLFPPSESEKWNDSMSWQPIPYHYDKDKYDYTLRRPNSYCPTYVKELEKVLSSDLVVGEIKANRNLFDYIEKNTKKPMKNFMDLFGLYQTLNSEEAMNLTLPEWTKSVYPEQIHAIAAKQCKYENYNPTLKRLNGGRMLKQVIQHMTNKSANSLHPPERKMYLYSGHENNVINILAALNLFEPHVPTFNSAVIIELYRGSDSDNYAVKVYYLRDVNTEPEVQKLEGCETLCPLNDFLRITEPHVPVNFTEECDSHINLD